MRSEKWMLFRRQVDNQHVAAAVVGGEGLAEELTGAETSPESIGGVDLATPNAFDPIGQLAAQEFTALVIDDEEPDVLIIVNAPQVFSRCVVAARLIGLQSFVEKLRFLRLQIGNFPGRAHGEGHDNRQDQEERLRNPVGEKDLEKEASHASSASAAGVLAWSRG